MTDERSAYDEKLESILRTAASIFAEKGYHQASIRDIARATGVSLSGLYYYFDSKEELLFLIQDHAFGTLTGNLERMLEGVEVSGVYGGGDGEGEGVVVGGGGGGGRGGGGGGGGVGGVGGGGRKLGRV